MLGQGVANALAYCDAELITTVKKFKKYRPGSLGRIFFRNELISEKLLDELGEGEDFADADRRLHGDEVVEVVR
jgi:hypothetical protein